MQKAKKRLAVVCAALLRDAPVWKCFQPHIDTVQFAALQRRQHDFIGMDIDEVLKRTAKDENYMVFTTESPDRHAVSVVTAAKI